jgi:hypothetical protein
VSAITGACILTGAKLLGVLKAILLVCIDGEFNKTSSDPFCFDLHFGKNKFEVFRTNFSLLTNFEPSISPEKTSLCRGDEPSGFR